MPRDKAQAAPALRFAALHRVSTEQQAQTGESLLTQKAEIGDAVSQLGGVIVEWYGGQEHATPGHEKKEIGRLLKDAAKKGRAWNAVIMRLIAKVNSCLLFAFPKALPVRIPSLSRCLAVKWLPSLPWNLR